MEGTPLQPRVSSRIDPAGWSDRVQMTVLVGLVTAWALGSLAWRPLGGLAPLMLPVVGALIWRYERTRVRDIASWTVPLAIVLFVAGLIPGPVGLVVSLAGAGVLAAMMFWSVARDGWLRLVAPGHYRVFRGPDRPIAERMAGLDYDANKAIERYVQTGQSEPFKVRLQALAQDAETMEISDTEWGRLRDLFVAWLRASVMTADISEEEVDSRFKLMAERHAAFLEATMAMAIERSSLLGGPRHAGPPA